MNICPNGWEQEILGHESVQVHKIMAPGSSFNITWDNSTGFPTYPVVHDGLSFIYTYGVFDNKPVTIKFHDVDRPEAPWAYCDRDAVWTRNTHYKDPNPT